MRKPYFRSPSFSSISHGLLAVYRMKQMNCGLTRWLTVKEVELHISFSTMLAQFLTKTPFNLSANKTFKVFPYKNTHLVHEINWFYCLWTEDIRSSRILCAIDLIQV